MAHYSAPRTVRFAGTFRPPSVSGHRIVCSDKRLYSFGGYAPHDNNENEPLVQLWEFHLYRRTWACVGLKGEVPRNVVSSAMALHGNRVLILIGGTGIPFGQHRSGDVYSCDLLALDDDGAVNWVRWPTCGEAPGELYGQAIIIDGDFLYMMGGTNGIEYSNRVYRLNIENACWEHLRSGSPAELVPPPRCRHEIAVFSGFLFVLGGGTKYTVYGFQAIHVFEVSNLTWGILPTIGWFNPSTQQVEWPRPRRCHSAVQTACSTWAVIAGGIDAYGEVFFDIWKLHLPSLSWYRYDRGLPQRIYFHSAAVTPGGRMYTFGGIYNKALELRTCRVIALDLVVPSLQEIALEMVMLMYPGIAQYSEDDLNRSELPQFIFAKYFCD